MKLGAADFGDFFCSIHGCKPFPWQQELVDRLAENDEWPDVLDLPTGAGKTAALDAAVFHLALRVDAPQKAALRIALVVDRRLVVDDAFARARKIARALKDPSRAGEAGRAVVVEIADRLKVLAGDEGSPLVAQRLRGGAPLEHDWARTPTQPTILCSTVDQVGSRLLFRGYGVSNRMKPVHAGLLGQDSLILLDEAHLSEPFRRTLAAVREIGRASVRTVLLSATPGVPAERPLGRKAEDRAHPILKQRIEATKPARLPPIVKNTPAETFVHEARAMKERLHQAGISAPAIGIVVNRVDLAREIFQGLKDDPELDALAELMIGRSRDVDRDRIVGKLEPFRTGVSGRSEVSASLLVVATQCLEVGVDVDLDGLVTQAASLDALRQRFGRLNRAGRRIAPEGVVLAIAEDVARKTDDPIYGDRIRKTWETLTEIAQDGVVDFGVAALEARLRDTEVDAAALASPRERAPVLMPAYLDLWSQTSPIPSADPEVGLFLHGIERTPAEVSFVWRNDITSSDLSDARGTGRLKVLMELMPPRAREMIEVPIWSARGWLRSERADAARLARVADVPGRDESDAFEEHGRDGQERKAFCWAGSDDPRTGVVSAADIRPGDVLVVPSDYGGCDAFGWAPTSDAAVEDVADVAARPFRGRRHTVRIAPNDAEWSRLSPILEAEGDGTSTELRERFLDILSSDAVPESVDEDPDARPVRSVREPLEALRRAKGRITRHFPYAGGRQGGVVFVAAHGLRGEEAPDLAAPATEDETHSRISSRRVSLDEHGHRVAELARRFVRTLRLPQAMMEDLSLAALLHDAGKADGRFQIMLSGGDSWNRPDGPVMAKSGRPVPRDAWSRAGLPKGWRHEALSVRMARAHPRFQKANDPALVLWLIGTHHGFGRPFFNFIDADPHDGPASCLGVETWRLTPDPGPQAPAFHFDGADWPALFDELKKRYGVWKLAWLEAILRLADHRASEEEHRTSEAEHTS